MPSRRPGHQHVASHLTRAAPPLPEGAPAPSFRLPRSPYETIALADFRERPVVLAFYASDWGPVCTEQLVFLQAHLGDIHDRGAVLVGISVDSVWCHLAFARGHGLEIPLLADCHPKGAVARAYRVYRRREGTCGRALFVVDGSGLVCWSSRVPDIVDPGIGGILTALESLARPGRVHGGARCFGG